MDLYGYRRIIVIGGCLVTLLILALVRADAAYATAVALVGSLYFGGDAVGKLGQTKQEINVPK